MKLLFEKSKENSGKNHRLEEELIFLKKIYLSFEEWKIQSIRSYSLASGKAIRYVHDDFQFYYFI